MTGINSMENGISIFRRLVSGCFIFCLVFETHVLVAQEPLNFPLWNPSAQIELPYDRFLQPAGKQVYFGKTGLENHALDCSLSPDGEWLAVQERYSIVFIRTADAEVIYELRMSDFPGIHDLVNGYSGITWDIMDGTYNVFWTASSLRYNASYLIQAGWDGTRAEFAKFFLYKSLVFSRNALANEFLIDHSRKGNFIYVVLNGNNQVIKQNLDTKDTLWIRTVGVAPYGITASGNNLYITNWGGRMPENGDKNVAGVPWGLARVDSLTGGTREGSVTVLDKSNGNVIQEILTGLHPNEIISGRRGKFIYITNSNSDNISVINTKTNSVSETITVRLEDESNPYFGDSPDGLALTRNDKILYVANGMDNAIAVVSLGKNASLRGDGRSHVTGYIPTGAYPSSISISQNNWLYVTNLEGEGSRVKIRPDSTKNEAYNAHLEQASVSIIKTPAKSTLDLYTRTVIALNQVKRANESRLPLRPNTGSRPVPERTGEPSLFKHVVYIIKENRTYDQVLGDVKEGNGDPTLCSFGNLVTPNTHQLVRDFTLLDNFYVSGKSSAEGHQWTDAAIVSDYIEKNMRAWFRSYPHVQNDALVYSPTGFLWDHADRCGKQVRIYGEAAVPQFDPDLKWENIYKNFLAGKPFTFQNLTTVGPVKKLLSPAYPGYDDHDIPDVLRADAFIKEWHQYESMNGDALPDLMIVALPADHTAGTRPSYPTPRAMVADNDLALGRMIEAITKSRFWKNTVVFVVEDDSQDGWDHVSAYRTVAMVISPYSRIRNTIHTRYNQPSIVRTIEQILGIPPMNIQDAIAPPMFDCFNSTLDTTSYNALPNLVPLDEMNSPLSGLKGQALKFALDSMEPQFDHIDGGNDDLLNRILWFATMGEVPYPLKNSGKEDERRE